MSDSDFTKHCTKCGEEQPLSAFSTDRAKPDGKCYWCKTCHKVYRDANRERRAEYQKRYNEENKERLSKQKYERRQANLEAARAREKLARERHRERNHERILQKMREWRKRNPDKVKQNNRRRYEANPEEFKLAVFRRRTILAASEECVSAEDIRSMYRDQGGLCAYCECELHGRFEIDHMIPVSRGGGNGWENIAIACRDCNRAKHTKTAEEFVEHRRRTLTFRDF